MDWLDDDGDGRGGANSTDSAVPAGEEAGEEAGEAGAISISGLLASERFLRRIPGYNVPQCACGGAKWLDGQWVAPQAWSLSPDMSEYLPFTHKCVSGPKGSRAKAQEALTKRRFTRVDPQAPVRNESQLWCRNCRDSWRGAAQTTGPTPSQVAELDRIISEDAAELASDALLMVASEQCSRITELEAQLRASGQKTHKFKNQVEALQRALTDAGTTTASTSRTTFQQNCALTQLLSSMARLSVELEKALSAVDRAGTIAVKRGAEIELSFLDTMVGLVAVGGTSVAKVYENLVFAYESADSQFVDPSGAPKKIKVINKLASDAAGKSAVTRALASVAAMAKYDIALDLANLVAGGEALLKVGSAVIFVHLRTRAELNGRRAIVFSVYNPVRGTVGVQLEDGRRVLVATRNLQVVVEQTSSADPGHAAVGPAVRDWLDTNAESIQRASASAHGQGDENFLHRRCEKEPPDDHDIEALDVEELASAGAFVDLEGDELEGGTVHKGSRVGGFVNLVIDGTSSHDKRNYVAMWITFLDAFAKVRRKRLVAMVEKAQLGDATGAKAYLRVVEHWVAQVRRSQQEMGVTPENLFSIYDVAVLSADNCAENTGDKNGLVVQMEKARVTAYDGLRAQNIRGAALGKFVPLRMAGCGLHIVNTFSAQLNREWRMLDLRRVMRGVAEALEEEEDVAGGEEAMLTDDDFFSNCEAPGDLDVGNLWQEATSGRSKSEAKAMTYSRWAYKVLHNQPAFRGWLLKHGVTQEWKRTLTSRWGSREGTMLYILFVEELIVVFIQRGGAHKDIVGEQASKTLLAMFPVSPNTHASHTGLDPYLKRYFEAACVIERLFCRPLRSKAMTAHKDDFLAEAKAVYDKVLGAENDPEKRWSLIREGQTLVRGAIAEMEDASMDAQNLGTDNQVLGGGVRTMQLREEHVQIVWLAPDGQPGQGSGDIDTLPLGEIVEARTTPVPRSTAALEDSPSKRTDSIYTASFRSVRIALERNVKGVTGPAADAADAADADADILAGDVFVCTARCGFSGTEDEVVAHEEECEGAGLWRAHIDACDETNSLSCESTFSNLRLLQNRSMNTRAGLMQACMLARHNPLIRLSPLANGSSRLPAHITVPSFMRAAGREEEQSWITLRQRREEAWQKAETTMGVLAARRGAQAQRVERSTEKALAAEGASILVKDGNEPSGVRWQRLAIGARLTWQHQRQMAADGLLQQFVVCVHASSKGNGWTADVIDAQLVLSSPPMNSWSAELLSKCMACFKTGKGRPQVTKAKAVLPKSGSRAERWERLLRFVMLERVTDSDSNQSGLREERQLKKALFGDAKTMRIFCEGGGDEQTAMGAGEGKEAMEEEAEEKGSVDDEVVELSAGAHERKDSDAGDDMEVEGRAEETEEMGGREMEDEEPDLGEGLPSDGLPSDGLPRDGLPRDGLPRDGLPSDGLPSDGLPRDGLPSRTRTPRARTSDRLGCMHAAGGSVATGNTPPGLTAAATPASVSNTAPRRAPPRSANSVYKR